MVGLEDTRYVDQMNDEWVIIQRFFPSTRLNFSGALMHNNSLEACAYEGGDVCVSNTEGANRQTHVRACVLRCNSSEE